MNSELIRIGNEIINLVNVTNISKVSDEQIVVFFTRSEHSSCNESLEHLSYISFYNTKANKLWNILSNLSKKVIFEETP